jgi:hypothetical protein
MSFCSLIHLKSEASNVKLEVAKIFTSGAWNSRKLSYISFDINHCNFHRPTQTTTTADNHEKGVLLKWYLYCSFNTENLLQDNMAEFFSPWHICSTWPLRARIFLREDRLAWRAKNQAITNYIGYDNFQLQKICQQINVSATSNLIQIH